LTNCSASSDKRTIESKVTIPAVAAWVEQRDKLSLSELLQLSGEIGAFVQVTVKACPCEIAGMCFSGMLQRNSVFGCEPAGVM
jgi:hypothetical protein